MRQRDVFVPMVLLIVGIFGCLLPVFVKQAAPATTRHASGVLLRDVLPADSAVVCYAGYLTGWKGPAVQFHYLAKDEDDAHGVARGHMPQWMFHGIKKANFKERVSLKLGDYELCVYGVAR